MTSTLPEMLIAALKRLVCVIEQIGRVAAVARAVHAEPRRVGDAHLDQLVRGGGDALEPRLAGIPDVEVDRRLHDDVAIAPSSTFATASKVSSKKSS